MQGLANVVHVHWLLTTWKIWKVLPEVTETFVRYLLFQF